MDTKQTPALRFKGFAGEWEWHALRELGETYNGLSGKTKEDFGHGDGRFVTYMNVFSNPVADEKGIDQTPIDDKQNLVKKGDVLFTTSSETPEEVGMSSVWMTDSPNTYLNSFCFGYRPKADFDLQYLAYLLRSPEIRARFTFLAQGISRYNISKNKVMDIAIPVSALEEQKEIGACFARLDAVLALARRRAERLAAVKRAMLAALFPKEGKTLPALRFQGFSGEWQRKRLGDLAQFTKGAGYSKADLRANGTPIILYGRLYTKYETVISDVDTFAAPKDGSLYSKGGEVIVPASGETAEDISIASVVEKPGVLLGGDLNVIRASESIDPVFLAITISHGKAHEDMSKMAQGKTVVHLHNTDLETLELLYPSLEEQKMIGAYFRRLDEIISLQARRAEKLTALKKALLGRMFV